MKAYAILAGGGVKGVALAGCLAAAEEKGIEFVGYGGTSAGSIVALLGAVGYKGTEIEDLMRQSSFTDFLDDGGSELEEFKKIVQVFFSGWWLLKPARIGWKLLRQRSLIRRLYSNVGLYKAAKLEQFLSDTVKAKLPRVADDFSFSDLEAVTEKLLKVVAADVVARKSLTFSSARELSRSRRESDISVITAVRASMSYPFVFMPVRMHNNYLTDGGICSNLPVFLFELERKSNNYPVLAFDLIVPEREKPNSDYKLFKFSEDMLMTTMESSDKLLQGLITGLHYIPVKVPKGIDTLKFSLSPKEQSDLFHAGYEAAKHYFENDVKHWFERGADRITQIRAQYFIRPGPIQGLLAAIARDFEANTSAEAVRCSIMVPSGNGTQMVAYQHGMTDDPDADWEIAFTSGWSGRAMLKRKVMVADLTLDVMGLSKSERAKIPAERKAALSIPLYDVSNSVNGEIDASQDRVIGTLNIDTTTSLSEAGWGRLSASPGRDFDLNDIVRRRCRLWGEILSQLLS